MVLVGDVEGAVPFIHALVYMDVCKGICMHVESTRPAYSHLTWLFSLALAVFASLCTQHKHMPLRELVAPRGYMLLVQPCIAACCCLLHCCIARAGILRCCSGLLLETRWSLCEAAAALFCGLLACSHWCGSAIVNRCSI